MKTLSSMLLAAAMLAAIAPVQAKLVPVSQRTAESLNTAFQAESNAIRRYEAFARQAEAEGHAQVAQLFRAAARSEAVHRDNIRESMRAHGIRINNFRLEPVKLGTTTENLKFAINQELYERNTMYPEYIRVARSDQATEAVRAMTQAEKTEAQHARLCQDALNRLGRNLETPYHVCNECGYMTAGQPTSRCPGCS